MKVPLLYVHRTVQHVIQDSQEYMMSCLSFLFVLWTPAVLCKSVKLQQRENKLVLSIVIVYPLLNQIHLKCFLFFFFFWQTSLFLTFASFSSNLLKLSTVVFHSFDQKGSDICSTHISILYLKKTKQRRRRKKITTPHSCRSVPRAVEQKVALKGTVMGKRLVQVTVWLKGKV